MMNDLETLAIKKALSGEWEEAIKLNREILKENPKDIEALNRLSRAFAETGNLTRARTLAKKVLLLDEFNTIAKKSLEKWRDLRNSKKSKKPTTSASEFLEEPGRTKIVRLLNPGSKKVIAKLDAGDEVKLVPHAHKLSALTQDGDYLGRLPDDLAAKLKKLMKMGNEYKALIKSVEKREIDLFLRETKRAESLSQIPSFTSEKIEYIAFTPPELIHKKEEMEVLEESEE